MATQSNQGFSNYNEFYRIKQFCIESTFSIDPIIELLWLIQADPNLRCLLRILENLKNILDLEEPTLDLPRASSARRRRWLDAINHILNHQQHFLFHCGDAPLITENKSNPDHHPLYKICMGSYPTYCMLFNKPSEKELRKKPSLNHNIEDKLKEYRKRFRTIKWFVLYAQLDVLEDINGSIPQDYLYISTNCTDDFLKAFDEAGLAVRQLSRFENYSSLYRAFQPTISAFCGNLESVADFEQGNGRQFLTRLIKKWHGKDPHLRKGSRRSGGSTSARRNFKGYLVEREGGNFWASEQVGGDDEPFPEIVVEVQIPPANEEWEETDLPSEELDTGQKINLALRTKCTERRSERDQIMAAIGAINRMINQNQQLPTQFSLLTAQEIGSLMYRLGKIIGSKDEPIKRRTATLLIMSFWLGKDLEDCRKLVYKTTEPLDKNRENADLVYFEDLKSWRIKAPVYKLKNRPSKEQVDQSILTSQYLYLPDMWNLNSCIKDGLDSSNPSDTPFTKHNLKTYVDVAKRILSEISTSIRTRVSLTKIRRELLYRLCIFSDPVYAIYLTGQAHNAAMVPRHYTTANPKEIENAYCKVANQLLREIKELYYADDATKANPIQPSDIETNQYVGAPNCPSFEKAKTLIAECQNKLSDQSDFTVTRYHNRYTLYTALVISFTTGYRAVRSIGIEASMRDLGYNVATISDKDSEDKYHTRQVWLSKTLNAQLNNYQQHMQTLTANWKICYPHSAVPSSPKNERLMFLKETQSESTLITFTPKIASRLLEQVDYHLPLNSNRRFLRSNLLERGCPTEIINAFMGHWRSGEEPHGSFSGFSTLAYIDKLKEHLAPILDDLGLKAIPSALTKQ